MRYSTLSGYSAKRERFVVVGLVVMLHVAAFATGLVRTQSPSVAVNDMSVSFAQMQSMRTQVAVQPFKSEPVSRALMDEPSPQEQQPTPLKHEQGVVSAPPLREDGKPASDATSTAPVVLDTQPDYRADYLNNPRPSYPMAARRMGFQGKVVLNVEVLAEGRAGQVQLYASSGHDILDNAALQTVKGWRFTPAHRFGQAVTEWFLVPINFSLEDNNA